MNREYTDEEKKLAAYALNMCTVSVSQIVDYNDIYVLEQEYEAVLNNLNLEKFPKTDALYKVLVEILNTVTFFRIQEIKKEQIERKYQKKVKNAIWSSMNALTILATGNPWAMAYAAITQIGIGYINYRREKAELNYERENEELELRITAMEQFHALQRELFTSAWKMAEEFGFLDQYRITERQLKQYNEILLDVDPKRRYDRLEEIEDNFEAYPQFWYFKGHAAYEAVKEVEEDEVREYYFKAAKNNFEKFIELQKMGLLREDQIVASCALEYVDLLDDKDKIIYLLDLAVSNASTLNDVRQLCAIGYLKLNSEEGKRRAIEQLSHLVNDGYNRTTNAQLLSYILVNQIINGSQEYNYYKVKYLTLRERVLPEYLYRLPDKDLPKECIDSDFVERQRNILKKKYTLVLKELIKKYQVEYNKVIPVPYTDREYPEAFFEDTDKARTDRENEVEIVSKIPRMWENFQEKIDIVSIKYDYLILLNRLLVNIINLELVTTEDELTQELKNSIQKSVNVFDKLYEKTQSQDEPFTFDDYKTLHGLSFKVFTEDFFKLLKVTIRKEIEAISDIVIFTKVESNLDDLCMTEGLKSTDFLYEHRNDRPIIKESALILNAELFGVDVKYKEAKNRKADAMCEIINRYAENLVTDISKAEIYYGRDTKRYGKYFSQPYLYDLNKELKKEALLIINDKIFYSNHDLILTTSGAVSIYKGKANSTTKYCDIGWINGRDLFIGDHPYNNKGIDLDKLKELIDELAKIE